MPLWEIVMLKGTKFDFKKNSEIFFEKKYFFKNLPKNFLKKFKNNLSDVEFGGESKNGT